MSDHELHLDDHKKILSALDCSQQVAGLDKDLSLIAERIKEMKEDREKSSKNFMWIGGMVFTIIMAVAGSAIQQNATVQVLQEKVMEQKDEINKLNTYIQDVDANLRYELSEIEQ